MCSVYSSPQNGSFVLYTVAVLHNRTIPPGKDRRTDFNYVQYTHKHARSTHARMHAHSLLYFVVSQDHCSHHGALTDSTTGVYQTSAY